MKFYVALLSNHFLFLSFLELRAIHIPLFILKNMIFPLVSRTIGPYLYIQPVRLTQSFIDKIGGEITLYREFP